MSKIPYNLMGQRFHRLVAIGKAGKSKDKQIIWQCLCDCGELTEVSSSRLRNGTIKSCGCLQREKARQANTKHGKYHSRIYSIWRNMITRCTNSNHEKYHNYGGRGITVCERWKIFENFYKDMGDPPDGLTIDRINVNGNYELGNCRWATKFEQEQNKRKKIN